MNYPFNVRSFFTNRETKDIGGGIVLWRGYFQSVRPGVGKMLINVDISTATMYKSGPLLSVCMDFLRRTDPRDLYRTPDREFLKLQRFISGVRVLTNIPGQPPRAASTPRVVKKLTRLGANKESFTTREGTTITVADYFKGLMNRPLAHPDLFCAEVCHITPCGGLSLSLRRSALAPKSRLSIVSFRLAKSCGRPFHRRRRRTYLSLRRRDPRTALAVLKMDSMSVYASVNVTVLTL